MLAKLFGSKARVRLLKLFLSKPGEKYYIRQIARDLKLQLNSVRRELENLEKLGLLVSNPAEEAEIEAEVMSREDYIKGIDAVNKNLKPKKEVLGKAEKKYFQVNRNFVLYEEVRALITKAQVLYEKDFVDKLNEAGTAKFLVLTGFFVGLPEMPVDMLYVGRANKPKLLKIIAELELELGRELNFTIMDQKEFRYRRDITDVFLYDILEKKNIVVIDEMGAG
jgi:DNA-binding MarR family transcriptional regulator